MPGIAPRPVHERAWSKVQKSDGCWLWIGARNPHGYGHIMSHREYGSDGRVVATRMALAHRVVYEALVGPIPTGLTLDHLCQNPACVNPAHLEPVTATENRRRVSARQTHCKHGHPLAGDNLLATRDGRRACRECSRRRCAARYVPAAVKRVEAALIEFAATLPQEEPEPAPEPVREPEKLQARSWHQMHREAVGGAK